MKMIWVDNNLINLEAIECITLNQEQSEAKVDAIHLISGKTIKVEEDFSYSKFEKILKMFNEGGCSIKSKYCIQEDDITKLFNS